MWGINRERRTLLAAIAGKVLDSWYGEINSSCVKDREVQEAEVALTLHQNGNGGGTALLRALS